MYGTNCSISCGRCFKSEQCHNINGTCMNGCDSGYKGFNCTEGDIVVNIATTTKLYLGFFSSFFFLIQNVTRNILGQTALKCVTQLVKAATNRREYVIMGVILDGGDSFVKMFINVQTIIIIVFFYFVYFRKTTFFFPERKHQ